MRSNLPKCAQIWSNGFWDSSRNITERPSHGRSRYTAVVIGLEPVQHLGCDHIVRKSKWDGLAPNMASSFTRELFKGGGLLTGEGSGQGAISGQTLVPKDSCNIN